MTIATPSHAFGIEQQGDILVLGTIWRGAMLGAYSSTDASIGQCLSVVADAGLELPAGAFDQCPEKRLLALREFISQQVAGSAAAQLISALIAWQETSAMRALVVDGSFTREGRRLRIESSLFQGGARRPCAPQFFTPFELFERLVSVKRASERLTHDLTRFCQHLQARSPH